MWNKLSFSKIDISSLRSISDWTSNGSWNWIGANTCSFQHFAEIFYIVLVKWTFNNTNQSQPVVEVLRNLLPQRFFSMVQSIVTENPSLRNFEHRSRTDFIWWEFHASFTYVWNHMTLILYQASTIVCISSLPTLQKFTELPETYQTNTNVMSIINSNFPFSCKMSLLTLGSCRTLPR